MGFLIQVPTLFSDESRRDVVVFECFRFVINFPEFSENRDEGSVS